MPIVVTDSISTSSPSDTYATHDSKLGRGGWHEVANIAERDAIPTERRRHGMAAFVQSEGRPYWLGADLVTWTVIGGSVVDEIDGGEFGEPTVDFGQYVGASGEIYNYGTYELPAGNTSLDGLTY